MRVRFHIKPCRKETISWKCIFSKNYSGTSICIFTPALYRGKQRIQLYIISSNQYTTQSIAVNIPLTLSYKYFRNNPISLVFMRKKISKTYFEMVRLMLLKKCIIHPFPICVVKNVSKLRVLIMSECSDGTITDIISISIL